MSELIALDMIARSDAAGLRRTVESVRPYVDWVVIGVDGRSDEETHVAARALADDYWTFEAADVGLTAEEWVADKIHFANARNLGRKRIKLPWVLVLDTDERLVYSEDLRALVRQQPDEIEGIAFQVRTGALTQMDPQRLARSKCCWEARTHNQLDVAYPWATADALIEQDAVLRSDEENARREAQRNAAMKAMETEAEAGDMSALYHVAKQAAHGEDTDAAVKWVQQYRSVTEVHGPVAADRAHLAFLTSCVFFQKQDYREAGSWAIRALLDGPQIGALCLLGDIADLMGDRRAALVWFEGACVTPEGPHGVPETLELRFKRREELRGG